MVIMEEKTGVFSSLVYFFTHLKPMSWMATAHVFVWKWFCWRLHCVSSCHHLAFCPSDVRWPIGCNPSFLLAIQIPIGCNPSFFFQYENWLCWRYNCHHLVYCPFDVRWPRGKRKCQLNAMPSLDHHLSTKLSVFPAIRMSKEFNISFIGKVVSAMTWISHHCPENLNTCACPSPLSILEWNWCDIYVYYSHQKRTFCSSIFSLFSQTAIWNSKWPFIGANEELSSSFQKMKSGNISLIRSPTCEYKLSLHQKVSGVSPFIS